ncbi:Multiple organellar RNA editing factor 5 chloroplastic/mitochondrial, partial [Dissostichus eleginoides]
PPSLPQPPLVYRPVTPHNHHLSPPVPPCSLFFAVDACTTLHSGRQRTVVMGDFLSARRAHVRVPGCLIILPDSYTDSTVKDFLSLSHKPNRDHMMLIQEQIQLNDLCPSATERHRGRGQGRG